MRCDEGYLCGECGLPVDLIEESVLYLRYVLGEIELEKLHLHREYHLVCESHLSQFITEPGVPTPVVPGAFGKAGLDPDFVRAEEARVNRGYRRLLFIPYLGVSVAEYPLHITPETI